MTFTPTIAIKLNTCARLITKKAIGLVNATAQNGGKKKGVKTIRKKTQKHTCVYHELQCTMLW